MAISRSLIASLSLLFALLSLVYGIMPSSSHAQQLNAVSRTDAFTDYELVNERLRITSPEYLVVPWVNGQARYRVMEQEIVPVRADSTQMHFVNHPGQYLIAGRDTPVIQTGEPGYTRGEMVVPLTIHMARQDEPHGTTFQVIRRIRIRVYNDEDAAVAPRMDRTMHSLPGDASAASLTADSPLATGQWYRIPIPADNIWVLDASYLEALGISLAQIDPRNIQIWTTSGYELPHRNSDPRAQLAQIPIIVEGESDGSFGSGDRVIFFGNGPNRAYFNTLSSRFEHRLHPFSTSNHVFLTVGQEPGLRLQTQAPAGSPTRDVTEFRDFRWLEQHREKSESRIKSGTQWFGQGFDPVSSASQTIFTDTLAGFRQGSDIEVWVSMAARSTSASRFSFTVNGSTALPDLNIAAINSLTRSTGLSARVNEMRQTLSGFSLNNDVITIGANYQNPMSASRGWVNWIRIRADRALQATGNRLAFHPPEDGDGTQVRYHLTGFTVQPIVLDITDPVAPVRLQVSQSGNTYTVTHSSSRDRRFLAQSTPRHPPAGQALSNQNIRNPSVYPDYVIITAEAFLDEAQRLAEYRRDRDGLTPVVVTQSQIFNEFNGGVPDFVALRDYVKHLYDRGAAAGRRQPEYLLMFGGTTYDYKGVISNPVMRNYVFTYQSEESIDRVDSYGSDDFFAFMGDNEGLWPRSPTPNNPINLMDIGVGRLPIQTVEEARLLVDKIKAYEDPRTRGDWRSLFTFIADDHAAGSSNDRDLHILNADGTADVIDQDATGIRLEKIYQISYPVENTSAGPRVPQATRAMVDRINDGTLIFNFSGHGSEQFLTDQRLFTSDDISRLNNRERPSIMVTATCSFGRFDDTEDNSGAEKMMLHPDGGLIAALTTTRVVYTSINPDILNFGLNIALTREMTRRGSDGRPQRLGDIFRRTKITPVGSEFNSRKFILLGDPAMRIGLPDSRMNITHINGQEIRPDTLFELRALDRVTLSGHVSRPDGSVNTTFDGEANVRVFDAKRLVRYPDFDWLQSPGCYLNDCGYLVQTDALFNGRVSVSGGQFQSEFIIPKDVSYSSSPGRIQTYARERENDAVGASSAFRIRGRNPDAIDDGSGPEIEIYLNDEMFIDGGVVDDSPQLIVLMRDNAGINTTGAGVGHEIVATLERDGDPASRRIITLNEFYQSDLDDFTSGRIEYPLDGLQEGHYRLRIRAWDVFNNLGESEVGFQVLDSQDLKIRNVFNYPNPMHNFTSFIFEHNQPRIPMDIRIRIFTLSGQPVTTIRREQYIPGGNMVRIDWHGRDDDQHRLASGTYLYHVQVRIETDQGRQIRDTIERLVILR
jgi:hypothetical protein